MQRINSLPIATKILLALLVTGILIVASPFVVVSMILLLILSIGALVVNAIRRRPLKRWGVAAAGALVALLVFTGIAEALYGGAKKPQTAQEASSPATTEKTQTTTAPATIIAPTTQPTTPPPSADDDGLSKYDAVVTVAGVVDGDTIKISPGLEGKDTVRLIGVDTPEIKDPRKPVQPFAKEASDFTKNQLDKKRVALELDVQKVDKYSRLLAYVWLPKDRLFNETLVKEGFAQVATYPPNVRYTDRFLAAQKEAREAKRGLWGAAQPAPAPQQPAPAKPAPGGTVSCSSFSTQKEAQEYMTQNPVAGTKLDRDKDGVACESLP